MNAVEEEDTSTLARNIISIHLSFTHSLDKRIILMQINKVGERVLKLIQDRKSTGFLRT
jgi:hypothetical protein